LTTAVTSAVPHLTVNVPVPAVVLAVRRPAVSTVPVVVVQVNDGCASRSLPNWSFDVAVNCWVAPALSVADGGLTTMLVIV
jgi:hypothetical protein